MTENEVILEKLNQIIDYLLKNPSYQVYSYNGSFVEGTLTYAITNITDSRNINVGDVVVFNNGYYGIISEITETEFTLSQGISLIGPQGPQGPKGDTGTVPEALPQEASALKSGELPTSGWADIAGFFFDGNAHLSTSYQKITTLSENDLTLIVNNWGANKLKVSEDGTRTYTYRLNSHDEGTDSYYLTFGTSYKIGMLIDKVTRDVTVARISNTSYDLAVVQFYNTQKTVKTYTISDTSITANSDILMELTDDGGVKSYSMEAGNMTVIRDTVPTNPIPYTYKVKQTNASGQFTLVNHFVPTKTSELTNDSGFITAADIPSAGEWQNWSDTSVLTEEGLYEIVTTEYPSDGNKTLFVRYEQGKPNNGACWVSVATANSISVVTPICSGDGTLSVERRLANSSGPADLLTFKYRKILN